MSEAGTVIKQSSAKSRMIWTEIGGPKNPAWKTNPMQIGNEGDHWLRALLFGKEGGELITPASIARRCNVGDSEYSRKLSYCLEVMRRSKAGEPACE